MKRLPGKFSKLIRLALHNLDEVERDHIYEVDMNKYHAPIKNPDGSFKECRVCLAGAVMAKHLGRKPRTYYDPCCFGEIQGAKLRALDYLRTGNLIGALFRFPGVNVHDFEIKNENITNYKVNKTRFKKSLLKIADQLEAVGL